MFAVLIKAVDGRRFDRYFKEWPNAEKEMLKEVKDISEHYGCKERTSIDRMNVEKGIYEREEKVITDDGAKFVWAIVGGYFWD